MKTQRENRIIHALVAQFPVSLSIQHNLDVIHTVLEQAGEGDLMLFPEGAISGYATDLSFLENIQADALQAALDDLHDQAQRRKIHVWAGACIREDGRWLNAAYGFTPQGRMHVYHKINLATHERGVFSAGDRLPVFRLEMPAGPVTVGVQICRELRFPEQWKLLAQRGAQLFLHLNNAIGAEQYQPVWRSFLVSRAAETQRFLLSANNAAPQQICPTLAVNPHGKILGEIVSAEMKWLRVAFDLSQVSDVYLQQSRTDVVEIRSVKD